MAEWGEEDLSKPGIKGCWMVAMDKDFEGS